MLDTIGTLARLGLAAVWLVSGAIKLASPGQTFIAVQAYDVLPSALVRPVATALPLVELVLGLLLLFGLATRWVATAALVMLAVLVAGIAQSWARGLSIDCGCFGGGGHVAAGQTEYPQEILRDTGFAVLAVWLMVRPRSFFSVDGWLGWGRQRAAVEDAAVEDSAETGSSAALGDEYSPSIAEGK
ncbi:MULTISPECIES: MauE/DoxX family redox-associated membrane protein [unclassified Amycolatopsis]|uniref:MauE/DoxX family redox-associated membrane protein n=1 Tax=unclassified Amycolatopsis TaxID=2618356 RepID=UPI001C6A641A|nr:MauE/DoxX family redox-associated membrane protein [Amycolatopsis sp. DSM 110486]QYN25389.1 DoxX family membrane protein [Amycolatopsis sp. DSM 110486]